jgi:ethanolamine utilization protein EutP (predicted NTPase)
MQSGEAWPTVLVLGATGAGKTSLLQAVFGENLVPEDRVGHGQPATHEFDCYERDGLRIFDSRGLEPGEYDAYRRTIDEFLSKLAADSDADRHIHVVWYAISGPGARVTEADLRTIREVSRHVLVLITKADITRADQLTDLTSALVTAGVPGDSIVPCSVAATSLSVDALLAKTTSLLSASHRSVVEAAAHRQRQAKAAAFKVVASSRRLAIAASIVPFGSRLLIKRIEQKMVIDVANCFGVSEYVAEFWKTVNPGNGVVAWWNVLGPIAAPWLLVLPTITSWRRVAGTGAAAIAFFSSGRRLSKGDLVAMVLKDQG